MVNIGDSYLIFYFIGANGEKKNEKKENVNVNGVNMKLKIKLFESNNNGMKEFNFENNPSNKIRIGRKNHGNDIELSDHLSSRVNCIIKYNEEKGWILMDGNEVILKDGDIKKNSSTNGTWFLAIENIKIVENLIFKSNFSIFKCSFVKN